MKKIIIGISLVLGASALYAKPVDESTAALYAAKCLSGRNLEFVYSGRSTKAAVCPAFYVYNNPAGGWIIISGEDAVTPVLGYSDTGKFVIDHMQENISFWFDEIESTVLAVREKGLSATKEVREKWAEPCVRTKAGMEGKLLQTANWGQGAPFNSYSPKLDYNGKLVSTPSGCGATALAIFMRYTQWPKHGYGTIPGYSYLDYGQTVTIPDNDISGHTYNWEQMPLNYTGSETTAQRNMASQVLYDAACALCMRFSNGGSSVYVNDEVLPLPMYFGYKSSTVLLYRSSFSDAEWFELVRNEIDSDRPVIYSGQGSGGHAFICDGYNVEGQFHMNWGWSGKDNGWFTWDFKIDAKTYFPSAHAAIFNAVPDEDPSCKDYDFIGIYEAISISGNSATIAVANYGRSTFTGKLRPAIVDYRGNIRKFIGEDISANIGEDYISRFTVKFNREDVRPGDRLAMFAASGSEYRQVMSVREGVAASMALEDFAAILLPENIKDGDVVYFKHAAGTSAASSTKWYIDGVAQSYLYFVAKSGIHTVKAEITMSDGSVDTITTMINVK